MQIRRSVTEDIIASIGLVMKKVLQSDIVCWFSWLPFFDVLPRDYYHEMSRKAHG
jgi:hypothetical protein